ncbi:hypothetical protein [Clostridium saccharobutylicum]|uniref:Uncharacterized protein n=1 Tax=Clostridium saccharobutylicum TaxID=169679 RepID=A0A1S8NE59_CLOSA|nr:hypothetical protein [Clostridium saccharobutylicum]OOM14571.1 hypothetical protein CLOSAC_14510 [Clostridium saccharobutylicum]
MRYIVVFYAFSGFESVVIAAVLSGSFAQMVGVSVISKFGQYIPTCFSVILFRKRNSKSSFRVIVSVCLSLWLLYSAWADDMGKPIIQNRVIIGLGGFIIGIPLYFLFKHISKVNSSSSSVNE